MHSCFWVSEKASPAPQYKRVVVVVAVVTVAVVVVAVVVVAVVVTFLHSKPFVVPEHDPKRLWSRGHTAFEHVLHVKPLLVLEQAPPRYEPSGQLTRSQSLQR